MVERIERHYVFHNLQPVAYAFRLSNFRGRGPCLKHFVTKRFPRCQAPFLIKMIYARVYGG